jgi:aspartate/methionine/tyrosine aminotransferase
VLPLNGSREGLFSAVFPALARKASVAPPAVLIPNPFYQAYAAAAAASGAEPVFLDSAGVTQFLPDLDAIDEQLLRRTVALYLCSPSNPQGAVADRGYLAAAIALARRLSFMLFADECYSEIYSDAPPPALASERRCSGQRLYRSAILSRYQRAQGSPACGRDS